MTWCQIFELKKADNGKPEAKEEGNGNGKPVGGLPDFQLEYSK
jgi:hypothetical protein